MAQSRGSKGLMALVALVPFVVISTMLFQQGGRVNRATNGRTSRGKREAEGLSRGAKERQQGRRLQTSSYNFATQLEMTVCLSADHTTDSAQSTTVQVRAIYCSSGRLLGLSVHRRSEKSEGGGLNVWTSWCQIHLEIMRRFCSHCRMCTATVAILCGAQTGHRLARLY